MYNNSAYIHVLKAYESSKVRQIKSFMQQKQNYNTNNKYMT